MCVGRGGREKGCVCVWGGREGERGVRGEGVCVKKKGKEVRVGEGGRGRGGVG